jgi:hypothetical protein
MLPALVIIIIAATIAHLIKLAGAYNVAPLPEVRTFSRDELMLVLLKEKKLTLNEANFIMSLIKEIAVEYSVHAWDPGSVRKMEEFMVDTVKVDARYAAAFHNL